MNLFVCLTTFASFVVTNSQGFSTFFASSKFNQHIIASLVFLLYIFYNIMSNSDKTLNLKTCPIDNYSLTAINKVSTLVEPLFRHTPR